MPPLSLNNIFPDPNSWQTTEGEKRMLWYSWTVIQSCRTKAGLACLHSQRKNMALPWQLQADNCNSDTNHFKSVLSFFPLVQTEWAEGWKQMGTVKEGSMLCTVVDGCMYVCILGTVFILSSSCSLPHLNLGANYWALHSVKCTAVVTVRAPWAVKFVCILTMGGFFSLSFSVRVCVCVCRLLQVVCLHLFTLQNHTNMMTCLIEQQR